jgi:hypothetical protein
LSKLLKSSSAGLPLLAGFFESFFVSFETFPVAAFLSLSLTEAFAGGLDETFEADLEDGLDEDF